MLLQTKLTSWAQRDTISGKHHIHRLEENRLVIQIQPTIELELQMLGNESSKALLHTAIKQKNKINLNLNLISHAG